MNQIIKFTSKIQLSDKAYSKICLILSEEGINASELKYDDKEMLLDKINALVKAIRFKRTNISGLGSIEARVREIKRGLKDE
jgi:hypothetical protein